mmetsp:Transcript_60064/g.135112  ORF Transcript_60064/g.135112 Transcript_60064/m.135112 type:complete len:266 (-) Transcript_60064:56-853(-)
MIRLMSMANQAMEEASKGMQDETSAPTSTTTAGGSPVSTSPLINSEGIQAHTKLAAQWIADMQPSLPPRAHREARGAGYRKSLFCKLEQVPPSAQLHIPPPASIMELPAVPEEDTAEAPHKAHVDDPDVLAHGPLEQRSIGFAGLLWSWRPCYVVVKDSVCRVYAREAEWWDDKTPTEQHQVADVWPNDREPDAPGICTFALVDQWGSEAAVFRCSHTVPQAGELSYFFDVAAKRSWIYALQQARRATQRQSAAGTGLHEDPDLP